MGPPAGGTSISSWAPQIQPMGPEWCNPLMMIAAPWEGVSGVWENGGGYAAGVRGCPSSSLPAELGSCVCPSSRGVRDGVPRGPQPSHASCARTAGFRSCSQEEAGDRGQPLSPRLAHRAQTQPVSSDLAGQAASWGQATSSHPVLRELSSTPRDKGVMAHFSAP